MSLETIIINGNVYSYYSPNSYYDFKLYQRQVKRVREKLRACENGCYKDKVTKKCLPYYSDYRDLPSFLESLLQEKEEEL